MSDRPDASAVPPAASGPFRSTTGGRTIARAGALANFWNYVERTTGERSLLRFVWQGAVLTLLYRLPTIWAAVLRGLFYRTVLGSIGSMCVVEEDVRFHVPRRVHLGRRVFIGQYSYLDGGTSALRLGDDAHVARFCTLRAGEAGIEVKAGAGINIRCYLDGNGGIEIGENSLLSPGVQVISGNHVFADPSVPIREQGTAYGKVTIGDDCWLGTNAIILPGVSVGTGSVVGAGAVVTKDLPDHSIAVGVPARIVGHRGVKGRSV